MELFTMIIYSPGFHDKAQWMVNNILKVQYSHDNGTRVGRLERTFPIKCGTDKVFFPILLKFTDNVAYLLLPVSQFILFAYDSLLSKRNWISYERRGSSFRASFITLRMIKFIFCRFTWFRLQTLLFPHFPAGICCRNWDDSCLILSVVPWKTSFFVSLRCSI